MKLNSQNRKNKTNLKIVVIGRMWSRTVPEDGSADVLAEPKDKDDVIVTVNWYRVALQFSYASGQYHHIAHGNIYETVKEGRKML